MNQVEWTNEDISVLGVTITHENILDKNYLGIVDKAKKILLAWNHRGLSLIGKIQVVNTLISSLFVYKMMVLPTIPKNIIKNMDNLIRHFLWNGKKSKIAYNILQNPKKEGGLNLVNLEKKDQALKATWPQIDLLHTEPSYAELVYVIMKVSALKENIWRCSINPEDAKKFKVNEFWKDVLVSWSQYNFYNGKRVENEIIWYNSHIKIQRKSFFWADVHKKGLLFVHQLFNNQQFKSAQMVLEEFGLSQLRFNSLKMAIPKDWKEFFLNNSKDTFMPLPPHNYDRITVTNRKGFAQVVYRYIADDAMLIHNKFMKWRSELSQDLLT